MNIHAIILAAGTSSRMLGRNKLLARFDGEPLVRRVARRAWESGVHSTTVIVGRDAAAICECLEDVPVTIVENPVPETGLSGSLKCGMAAIPPNADGILVMLADMPFVETHSINLMIQRFAERGGQTIIRAAQGAIAGHPVILTRACLPAMAGITGDQGAKGLLQSGTFAVETVEIGGEALRDVDTPNEVAEAGGVFRQ